MSFFALLTLDEIMIPDRIGNIGNTQGVNDKSNPETKNPNNERIKLLFVRVFEIFSVSDIFNIGSADA